MYIVREYFNTMAFNIKPEIRQVKWWHAETVEAALSSTDHVFLCSILQNRFTDSFVW